MKAAQPDVPSIHQSNDRLDHDLDACVRHQVPMIITSLRAPTDVVKRIHEYGGVAFHDVISVRHAHKALEAGMDGLALGAGHRQHQGGAADARVGVAHARGVCDCAQAARAVALVMPARLASRRYTITIPPSTWNDCPVT